MSALKKLKQAVEFAEVYINLSKTAKNGAEMWTIAALKLKKVLLIEESIAIKSINAERSIVCEAVMWSNVEKLQIKQNVYLAAAENAWNNAVKFELNQKKNSIFSVALTNLYYVALTNLYYIAFGI